MGAKLLQLMAHILLDILESVEEGRSDCGGSGAIPNCGLQILFARFHQSAISVIYDHEFFGAKQIVRYQ
jgi:hypothetical protein